MILVTMVFATDESPLDMEGNLRLDGSVDVRAMLTATDADNGGVFLSTYLDPEVTAAEAAELFESAAEAFRAEP